jgi:hypothetical protein
MNLTLEEFFAALAATWSDSNTAIVEGDLGGECYCIRLCGAGGGEVPDTPQLVDAVDWFPYDDTIKHIRSTSLQSHWGRGFIGVSDDGLKVMAAPDYAAQKFYFSEDGGTTWNTTDGVDLFTAQNDVWSNHITYLAESDQFVIVPVSGNDLIYLHITNDLGRTYIGKAVGGSRDYAMIYEPDVDNAYQKDYEGSFYNRNRMMIWNTPLTATAADDFDLLDSQDTGGYDNRVYRTWKNANDVYVEWNNGGNSASYIHFFQMNPLGTVVIDQTCQVPLGVGERPNSSDASPHHLLSWASSGYTGDGILNFWGLNIGKTELPPIDPDDYFTLTLDMGELCDQPLVAYSKELDQFMVSAIGIADTSKLYIRSCDAATVMDPNAWSVPSIVTLTTAAEDISNKYMELLHRKGTKWVYGYHKERPSQAATYYLRVDEFDIITGSPSPIAVEAAVGEEVSAAEGDQPPAVKSVLEFIQTDPDGVDVWCPTYRMEHIPSYFVGTVFYPQQQVIENGYLYIAIATTTDAPSVTSPDWLSYQLGGETNTASTSGLGTALTLPKVGSDLPFKSISAGPGISLTESNDNIQISSTGGGGGGSGEYLVTEEIAEYELLIGNGVGEFDFLIPAGYESIILKTQLQTTSTVDNIASLYFNGDTTPANYITQRDQNYQTTGGTTKYPYPGVLTYNGADGSVVAENFAIATVVIDHPDVDGLIKGAFGESTAMLDGDTIYYDSYGMKHYTLTQPITQMTLKGDTDMYGKVQVLGQRYATVGGGGGGGSTVEMMTEVEISSIIDPVSGQFVFDIPAGYDSFEIRGTLRSDKPTLTRELIHCIVNDDAVDANYDHQFWSVYNGSQDNTDGHDSPAIGYVNAGGAVADTVTSVVISNLTPDIDQTQTLMYTAGSAAGGYNAIMSAQNVLSYYKGPITKITLECEGKETLGYNLSGTLTLYCKKKQTVGGGGGGGSYAYREQSVGQSIPASTQTVLLWDVTEAGSDDAVFDTTLTDRTTINVAGVYNVTYAYRDTYASSSSTLMSIGIKVYDSSDVLKYSFMRSADSAWRNGATASASFIAAVGDYVVTDADPTNSGTNTTRPDATSFYIETAGGGGTNDVFQGAGTTGLVPDPLAEQGYVLSDSGAWVPQTGGGDQFNIDGGVAASVYNPPENIIGGGA